MNFLTVGGGVIDVVVLLDESRIEEIRLRNAASTFLLLEQGSKTEADQVRIRCGGGAVNAAIAAARLGHKAAVIAKTSNDGRGETLIRALRDEGVDTVWLRNDGHAPTGTSVIISAHEHNAAIFAYRGANSELADTDIPVAAFETADAVFVANLSNQSANCFSTIAVRARAAGCKLAANPGIRQLTLKPETLLSTLASLDILIINRKEAEALMPRLLVFSDAARNDITIARGELPSLAGRNLRSGGCEMPLLQFFNRLAAMGVSIVALTDGKQGAFVSTGDRLYFQEAVPATTASTVGAGDAFAATLCCYLWEDSDVALALRAAATNAAAVIEETDANSGLLRHSELERRLRAGIGSAPGAARQWPLLSQGPRPAPHGLN